MGELEDQIARIASARAAEVPAYRPPVSLDDRRPGHRPARLLVATAAALALLLGFGAWLAWPEGDDNPSVRSGESPTTAATTPTTVPETTAPPTTTPAPVNCPAAQGSTTNAKSGAGRLTNAPESAVLANVQVQSSQCVDEVSFSFGKGLPDWSVEYRNGPFTLDPSGQPVTIEGSAFLFVRFEHAEGSRAGSLPAAFHPGSPSHVTELRRTQDFEGIVTWVIGLDARLPFRVEQREPLGWLVVQLPIDGTARSLTCTQPAAHATVSVPAAWFVELTDEFHCSTFGPKAFVIVRNSDAPVPATVNARAQSTIDSLQNNAAVASSTTRSTTIDGHPGRVMEGTWSGAGFYRAGMPFLYEEAEWGAAGLLTISTTGYDSTDYQTHKAGVEAIAAGVRFTP